MEQVITAIVAELARFGLPGLIIALLLYKIRELEKDRDAKLERINELQEKRIHEAVETVRTLSTHVMATDKMAEALESMSVEQRNTGDRLERVEERIEKKR